MELKDKKDLLVMPDRLVSTVYQETLVLVAPKETKVTVAFLENPVPLDPADLMDSRAIEVMLERALRDSSVPRVLAVSQAFAE